MNPNIFDRSHVASIFIPATRGNRVNTSTSILIHIFSFLPGDKLPPCCSSVPLTAFVLRTFTCQHQHLMKRHEIVICWFHTGQLNTAPLPLQTVSHAHSSLPLARIICTWEPICACTHSHCEGMSLTSESMSLNACHSKIKQQPPIKWLFISSRICLKWSLSSCWISEAFFCICSPKMLLYSALWTAPSSKRALQTSNLKEADFHLLKLPECYVFNGRAT